MCVLYYGGHTVVLVIDTTNGFPFLALLNPVPQHNIGITTIKYMHYSTVGV